MSAKLGVISGAIGTLSAHAERNGLVLTDDLTLEQLGSIGEALGQADRTMQWWLGDWWLHIRKHYGERGLLALVDGGCKLPPIGTLRRVATVAKAFPADRRRSRLSFGHHHEVARIEDLSVREFLLDRAEQFGWSTAQLRSEVAQRKLLLLTRPGERQYATQTIDDLTALVVAGQQFGTIYADPPWPYGNQATRAATRNHYKAHNELSLSDIAALPVNQLSSDAAHCHLWTTNGFLREAFEIIEAWGFTYKSCFIWVKPDFGIGNYWRVGHEFMLFGIKGAAPFRDKNQQSWIYEQAGEHSAKPGKVRKIIEGTSPAPRLELFGRKEVDGWTVWGNEIQRASDVSTLL